MPPRGRGFQKKKRKPGKAPLTHVPSTCYNMSRQEVVRMKASELARMAKKQGCYIKRHGSRHDIWFSPITGKTAEIPRHQGKDVKTGTARSIIRDLGLE